MSERLQLTFDSSRSVSYEVTPQGFLRCRAIAGKVGVLEYKRPDGSILRQFRSPEELFSQASMDSLRQIPVCNEHPVGGMINSKNASMWMKGFTGENVERVDDKLASTVTVTDDSTISDVKSGKTEVSTGYICVLDFTPGVFEGKSYDCIQRNIRYNHFAIVKAGRAGAEVSLQLDAESELLLDVAVEQAEITTEASVMKKINIDGVSFEVNDDVAGAWDKFQAKHNNLDSKASDWESKFLAEKAMNGRLQGQLDAATDNLKAAKIANVDSKKTDDENFHKAVQSRIEILTIATPILDSKEMAGIEKLGDIDLMKKVILKEFPHRNLDDKEEPYIRGQFEHIKDKNVAANVAATKGGEALQQGVEVGNKDSKADMPDSKKAKEKALKESKERGRKPLNA